MAGFAGVETLGGINDFVRDAIRFYPNLTPEFVRTILVSSDEFILPELGSKLGAYAQRKLAARGVEIITRARVTGVRDGIVELSDGRTISATTLIWAAGNAPNPLVAALPMPKSGGRILVNEYLEVKEFPGVWALGDCASIPDRKTGGFHPPTAQHAIREGRCAARNVAADILRGRKKTVSLLDVRKARRDRTALRGGECFWPQFFGISCVVALADNLLVQAPTARKEDAGRSRLDTGSVFREGFCMRDRQTSFEHDGVERL